MTSDPPPGFRTGMVAMVGRTNVGKSTLLNALVHHKVSIVSPRPQTTRHVIQGVIHCPNGQLILADTPGFFQTHRNQLVDRLHARARAALDGVDAILHVVDPSRPIGKEDAMVLETLAATSQARILCLNKLDLRDRPHRAEWMARSADYTDVLEVSAIARRNLDLLIGRLLKLLPEGPPLYGKEEVTNAHRDFRITEIIREHIYVLTSEEVPYRTAVRLDGIDERPGKAGKSMLRVRATILVAQDRYKAMLIGAGGRMVRNIGTGARTEIQRLLNAPIFLDLSVRVDPRLGSSLDL